MSITPPHSTSFEPDVSANEVLLFIHGGGYTGGSAESSLCLAAWISHETKATVFSINYRLAPEYPFPAAINDTNEIYKWVLQEGINPSKLCVAGGSAGGGLALALMIHLKKESISLPACCVLMSPWTDLSQSGDTYQINKSVDPVMKKEYLESFSEDYLQGQESSNPLASPLFGDLLGLPPTLIQVGSSEVMLGDSKRVYEKAKSAGALVPFIRPQNLAEDLTTTEETLKHNKITENYDESQDQTNHKS